MESLSPKNRISTEFSRRTSLIVKSCLDKIKNKRQSQLPDITIAKVEDKAEELDWGKGKLFELTDEEKKRLVLKKGYAFK